MAETQRDIARIVLAVLFIAALIGSSIWILRPFLGAIVWSTTIVVATWPLMLSIQRWLWCKRSLAVTAMTLVLLCVLVIPLSFAIVATVSNIDVIVGWTRSLAGLRMPPPPEWIINLPVVGAKIAAFWASLAADGVQQITARAAPYAATVVIWFVAQLGNIGVLLVEFLLTVILAATMYANGEHAAERLVRFGRRLAGSGGENAIYLAGQTVRGVALGVVVTSFAQTVFSGLGLFVAGVPFAGILTGAMLLLSIAQIGVIPVLGCAVAWLYWTGESGWGTFMLVWMIIAGTMDNFLRPILIKKGADLPLLLVFAGVIGGLIGFGLIGIFVGPVILAVAEKLLMAWIEGDIHQAQTPDAQ
ncbi:MAG: AI-2E family transporter YdiK [Deltaproteobacteria bacterium]